MNKISLNGGWICKLPDSRILQVSVPGCFDRYIEEKDIGDTVIYSKEFDVKKEDEFYQLYFGGVSYFCRIYVNGHEVGHHEGIWDNFRIDVSDALKDGKNIVELYIQKPGYHETDQFKVREVLSGFIPDVLCTFGGIWDDVFLESTDDFYVTRCYGKGDLSGKTEIKLELDGKIETTAIITGKIIDSNGTKVIDLEEKHIDLSEKTEILLCEKLTNPLHWSTEQPNLYTFEIIIKTQNQSTTLQKKFGYREISTDGTNFILNGKPIYTRGILHWGYYDDDMIPNPSRNVIQDEIDKCKQFGFNMIKHCLYIPREEYFELADENGILLWVELPVWLPDLTPELEPRIEREFPEILKQLEGHPSIVLISLGCELDSKVSSNILERMYYLAKNTSNALIRDNSGSGECYDGLSVDFADFFDYHFYGDLQSMENLMETFTPTWRSYRPWVYGEFCDSDTMRDLEEIRKRKKIDVLSWEKDHPSYNPISTLKPDFFAGAHDKRMKESGIRKEFEHIKKLSYDHSMVHRKVTLEQTRSFPEISGYNITSIRDVPIATSGIFDDFMEPKFNPVEMKKYNSDVILLPAWDLTRVWINADRVMNKERYNFYEESQYGLHILLSNYGNTEITNPQLHWKLTLDEKLLNESNNQIYKTVKMGEVTEVEYISLTLPKVKKPETCVLTVALITEEKTIENNWPIYIYPNQQSISQWKEKSGVSSPIEIGLYDPFNIFTSIEKLYDTIHVLDDEDKIENIDMLITSRLTTKIKQYLNDGGKVFYVQRGQGPLPVVPVAFWREGMIRSFSHPIMDQVAKKEWFDDLRYFSLSTDTALDTVNMKEHGFSSINPMIRRYDCREWKVTDYMAEFEYGEGKMIASTLRFEGGMGKQPMFLENNCYGRWLIDQIIEYLMRKSLKT